MNRITIISQGRSIKTDPKLSNELKRSVDLNIILFDNNKQIVRLQNSPVYYEWLSKRNCDCDVYNDIRNDCIALSDKRKNKFEQG